jgi:RHS repeat-associated protein
MYPAIMRFTTPDPLAEKYYSISPYAYCGNNPVNRIDPTGENRDFMYSQGKKEVM